MVVHITTACKGKLKRSKQWFLVVKHIIFSIHIQLLVTNKGGFYWSHDNLSGMYATISLELSFWIRHPHILLYTKNEIQWEYVHKKDKNGCTHSSFLRLGFFCKATNTAYISSAELSFPLTLWIKGSVCGSWTYDIASCIRDPHNYRMVSNFHGYKFSWKRSKFGF